jgi:copper chaperone CopZ
MIMYARYLKREWSTSPNKYDQDGVNVMKIKDTKKYKITKVDCASCAAKIEGSLQQLDGVDYASLDFANQILHLQADDLDKVEAQIKLIEPEAELSAYQHSSSQTPSVPATINWLSL